MVWFVGALTRGRDVTVKTLSPLLLGLTSSFVFTRYLTTNVDFCWNKCQFTSQNLLKKKDNYLHSIKWVIHVEIKVFLGQSLHHPLRLARFAFYLKKEFLHFVLDSDFFTKHSSNICTGETRLILISAVRTLSLWPFFMTLLHRK